MGKKPKRRPTFFKVLCYDFATTLKIPPLFVKIYKERIPDNPVLKTQSAGESWVVKMEQISQRYCFTKGWSKFVKDHKLVAGDFCVFWLNGDSTFDVAIYGRSCCDKELDLANRRNVITNSESSVKSEENEEDSAIRWPIPSGYNKRSRSTHPMKNEVEGSVPAMVVSCAIVVKKYNKGYLSFPAGFGKAIGIQNHKRMVLRDPEGRTWDVNLNLRRNSGGRVDVNGGWPGFRRGSNIADGDTCLFEFIQNSGNLLNVQIFKQGKGTKPRNRY